MSDHPRRNDYTGLWLAIAVIVAVFFGWLYLEHPEMRPDFRLVPRDGKADPVTQPAPAPATGQQGAKPSKPKYCKLTGAEDWKTDCRNRNKTCRSQRACIERKHREKILGLIE